MTDRPNVLFIDCDALLTGALGCRGHAAMRPRTPDLDRLAERGVPHVVPTGRA